MSGIDASRLWREIGIEKLSANPRIKSKFEELAVLGKELANPAADYHIKNIHKLDSRNSLVVTDQGLRFESTDLARILTGSKQLAAFLITIGKELEDEVVAFNCEGDPMDGYILDSIGSEIVEAITKELRGYIAKEHAYSQGCKITHRFCPGYGDWSTGDQRKLFKLLNADQIGVRLKSSGMMDPRKSYAGVFGLGPEVKATQPFNESKFYSQTNQGY